MLGTLNRHATIRNPGLAQVRRSRHDALLPNGTQGLNKVCPCLFNPILRARCTLCGAWPSNPQARRVPPQLEAVLKRGGTHRPLVSADRGAERHNAAWLVALEDTSCPGPLVPARRMHQGQTDRS